MRSAPTENELAALPKLHSTKAIPDGDKIIHMHFFLPGFDWYAVTFDGQDTFMGFVVVHGDPANAEYGYFSLSELQRIAHNGMKVSRDLNWEPIPARCIGIAR